MKNGKEEMQFDTISVIGLGYIGLPTAAVIASRKKKVIGVDISQNVVDTINEGKIHIVEPELDIVVHATVIDNFLRAVTTPEAADAFLIAVPTPFKGKHEPDLSYIEFAAKAIAPVLKKDNLIILESTSPVGATEQMSAWLAEARPDLTFPQTHGEDSDIRIAHCPERVLPGHVIRELVQNDRVVGGMTPACSRAAVELYQIFVEGECITTDVRTAEMCKLTENSFRDVNIAFANELSVICDKLGINVWELIKLSNRHPRVDILQPGAGVGGHCIAVDPWFIVSKTPEEAKLIHSARLVNDSKPCWVVSKVQNLIAQYLLENPEKEQADLNVICCGLAFKPDIDDLRESPALAIVDELSSLVSGLKVVEPNIESLPQVLVDNGCVQVGTGNILDADIAVILVSHSEFLEIDFSVIPAVLDFVGIWNND